MSSWTRGRKVDCPDTRAAIRDAVAGMRQIKLDLDVLLPEDLVDFVKTMSGDAMTNPELLLSCLYPALAVAIGPHVRAQASSEITTLTPLNVFVLAAANPATGKSSAFRAAVEKPMRMIEESLQCPFLYSEMTKNGLILLQESGKGHLMLGNDEAGSMLKDLMTGHQADAMRSLLNNHYSGQKYGYKSGTTKDNDVDARAASVCTSVVAMTQIDNCAAALHHMLDNVDGLLDRFIIWSPPPIFYFQQQLEHIKRSIDAQPNASAENLPALIHSVHQMHAEVGATMKYTFDVTAQQLLMDVRNEAMARAHWLELGEWPSEELTGGPTVRGLIPDAVLGLGQTRFWENLVRISTLHHVLCHALRCLKMGARELHIPDTITAETVEQAREFMEKTSMAKALVTEAYCTHMMLPVAALPPVADAVDNSPAPTVPQPVASSGDRGPRWHIEREVLLKPGQVLRVREDIKGNRRKGAALSSEMDLVLEDLVRKGLGRLVRDGSRKKYFVKTTDIPTDEARHYNLTVDIYRRTMARSNNSRMVVQSDSVLCHQDTGTEVEVVDLGVIATPPRSITKKTSPTRKSPTNNVRSQAKASKPRKGVRFLDVSGHDSDEEEVEEVSPRKKGRPEESGVAASSAKDTSHLRSPGQQRKPNHTSASEPATSRASTSYNSDAADEENFVEASQGRQGRTDEGTFAVSWAKKTPPFRSPVQTRECNENAASQDIVSRSASPSEKGDPTTRGEREQSAEDISVIGEPTHSQIGTWL